MTPNFLEEALSQLDIGGVVDNAEDRSLVRLISFGPSEGTDLDTARLLARYAFIYESRGIERARQTLVSGDAEERPRFALESFDNAFICLRAITSLPMDGYSGRRDEGISEAGVTILREEYKGTPFSTSTVLAFRLAASAVMAERTAEARLELERFQFPESDDESWATRVGNEVLAAFALLVRKSEGWTDIDAALQKIDTLRRLQGEYEDRHLDELDGPAEQTLEAVKLLGLYHLAQLLTMTGAYLTNGNEAISQIETRLDRHFDRATSAFHAASDAFLAHLASLLWLGCKAVVRNSIWTHVNGLGEQVREYAQVLMSRGRPNPVIELWPSQQEALRRNLLDPYRRAVLVQMPTSAGKTLLAKFAIVQAKALNPNGTIAYVVPTRALVNQVTVDLRSDFRELDVPLRVELAVPAFELDPTEEQLLQTAPDVLVTTPEKLDLLVRRGHPSTQNLALVVADEAHNIGDPNRGPLLELLLGTIKRDRAGARFLLLSPYLPNSGDLLQWLGDDRALPAIAVDWKPSRRLVGAIDVSGRGAQRSINFITVPAADNQDVASGLSVPIAPGAGVDRNIKSLTRATVQSAVDKGTVLVLCRGPGTAVTRAGEIAEVMPELPTDQHVEAVCHYLETEMGGDFSLTDHLRRGVAYHHAGISHEARWLIEGLIRRDRVNVICGTTTLAQGVNFPISTVLIESLKKGTVELAYEDFWNIAGRAGRALMDAVGVVGYPAPSAEKREEFEAFLQGEAVAISSQLAQLIDHADAIAAAFNMKAIANWPQLSSLLQFLSHAMRVSGGDDIADEVEDLLRASLVYHQAKSRGEDVAKKLVALCRAYLVQIRGQQGLLSLADQTGFATPTVLSLLAKTSGEPEFSEAPNWLPDRLFGEDLSPLLRRVESIADLPEMELGQAQGQPFSAQKVTGILHDWVAGASLDDLARSYLVEDIADPDKRVMEFSKYLFSKLLGLASWGMGALQSVSLAGQDDLEEYRDAGYVPSMIFFGVSRVEAVWLRMVGVPRPVAGGLGELWASESRHAPASYEDIRSWVSGLSDSAWRGAIPAGSSLTPADMRLIWNDFVG